MKPSFIIIGGVKCGTSSLYRYLNEHPNVLPCKIKEPMIFNTRNIFKTFYKLPWYYRLFPEKEFTGLVEANWIELLANDQLENSIIKKQKEAEISYITGEASAATFTQAYPWLVKKIFPDIKLIVLLRNPTQRFISHYKMSMRFAKEGRKQYQKLTLNDFVSQQINNFKKGSTRNILMQGIYVYHLKKWLKNFKQDQLYIGKTDDLLNPSDAQKELNNIFRFLNLDEYKFPQGLEKFNVAKKYFDTTNEEIRLNHFYKPYNEALGKQFKIHI